MVVHWTEKQSWQLLSFTGDTPLLNNEWMREMQLTNEKEAREKTPNKTE